MFFLWTNDTYLYFYICVLVFFYDFVNVFHCAVTNCDRCDSRYNGTELVAAY